MSHAWLEPITLFAAWMMQTGEILASQQRICWLSISPGSDTRMHGPKIRSPGTLLEPFAVGLQSWANVSHLVSFGYWFFPCADDSQVANLSRHAHVRQLELDTAFWAAWHGPNQETPSFGHFPAMFHETLQGSTTIPKFYAVFTPLFIELDYGKKFNRKAPKI